MPQLKPAKNYEELREQVLALQRQLSLYTTESVVMTLCMKWLSSEDSPDKLIEEVGFLSPLRQTYYLLGLLYTTEQSPHAKKLTKRKWKEVASKVATIFNYYTLLFHPKNFDRPEEEWTTLETTFSAFADFLGKPRVRGTIEQYCDKVRDYFSPWDAELKQILGISASEALAIYREMNERMQESLDRYQDVMKEWRAFCEVFDQEGSAAAGRFMEEAKERHEHEGPLEIHCLARLKDLRDKFPETAPIFWEGFCLRRPLEDGFFHPTDRNPAERRPLFEIRDGEALVPIANVIVSAMIEQFDEALKRSSYRERYLRSRDKTLERQAKAAIQKIVPPSAFLLESVFETDNGHHEHDLLAIVGDVALVVECKASGLREPLRDPKKAYTRLRDDFRADKGIQKAYDQAERLRRRLLSGSPTILFNRRGEEVVRLEAFAVTEVFCVCVTAEDWGLLAIKLSLLLEKRDEDPYPWAVNVLDLELILEAFLYRSWGWPEYVDFLSQRSQLHHRIFTDDELDVAGIFVMQGSFQKLIEQEADRISVHGHHSKVFDRIWRSKHGGGEVAFDEPLTFTDLRDVLGIPGRRVDDSDQSQTGQLGRNDLCHCGSGLKYKRCHLPVEQSKRI